jgi:hypothetical protein
MTDNKIDRRIPSRKEFAAISAGHANILDPESVRGVKPNDSGSAAEIGAMAILQLRTIRKEHQDRMAGISLDDYSQAGLAKKQAKARAVTQEKLAEARLWSSAKFTKKLDAARKGARESLDDGLDPSARAIVFTAIWNMLPTKPDDLAGDDLAAVYERACDTGDAVTCAAIEALPSIHALAPSPEDVERFQNYRLASANPKMSEELGQLNAIADDIESLTNFVASEAGDLAPDMVAEILAGEAVRDDDGRVVPIAPEDRVA